MPRTKGTGSRSPFRELTWRKVMAEFRLDRMYVQHIVSGETKVVVHGRCRSAGQRDHHIYVEIPDATETTFALGSDYPTSERKVGLKRFTFDMRTRTPVARTNGEFGVALEPGEQVYFTPFVRYENA